MTQTFMRCLLSPNFLHPRNNPSSSGMLNREREFTESSSVREMSWIPYLLLEMVLTIFSNRFWLASLISRAHLAIKPASWTAKMMASNRGLYSWSNGQFMNTLSSYSAGIILSISYAAFFNTSLTAFLICACPIVPRFARALTALLAFIRFFSTDILLPIFKLLSVSQKAFLFFGVYLCSHYNGDS